VANRRVYVATYDGAVSCLDVTTGDVCWTRPMQATSAPWVWRDRVYVAQRNAPVAQYTRQHRTTRDHQPIPSHGMPQERTVTVSGRDGVPVDASAWKSAVYLRADWGTHRKSSFGAHDASVGFSHAPAAAKMGSVRDLVGDFSRPADRFPPEDFVNGFKNQLRTQGVPPLLAEAYSASAEKLALNAFRAGDVNGLIPCKPASAADTKCRDEFVRSFGMRAFRRPLTDGELGRYAALFAAQAGGASGRFLDGARVVVEAMLQSPKFLFHAEAAANGRLRDYELASRLAYLLWDTMPDQRLFDAAAKGELRTPEGLERTARRMLEDPHGRQAVDEFFAEWLRFDRVLSGVKDRRRYPEFTPELAAMMVQETRMLLDGLVWSDGNFMEAFTAGYSFLNADLASLYRVPAPSGEFERVRFPDGSPRAGLLGHASFLSSTAGPVGRPQRRAHGLLPPAIGRRIFTSTI